jgi:putative transcriptional regulator
MKALGRFLEGQLLVAMPGIGDPRFERTVIYMCSHSAEGAMGLIINKTLEDINLEGLLDQLDIDVEADLGEMPIYTGGPVEQVRGFVLHSTDYMQESTLKVGDGIALTATLEILRDIAKGCGPKRSLVALGYAGWAPGQLDRELTRNGWLTAAADEALVFDADLDTKWPRAIAQLGFDVGKLSAQAGHA